MLKHRILSAIILVPIGLLIILYAPKIIFDLVILVLTMIGLNEYFDMIFAKDDANTKAFNKIVGLVGGFVLSSLFIFSSANIFVVLIFLLIAFFMISLTKVTDPQISFKNLSATIFGLFYISILFPFLVFIRGLENGEKLLIIFLVIILSGDTGAYFVGKKFGKKKLCPQISPGKTVEGAIGGTVSSILVALLFKQFFYDGLSWMEVIGIAFFVSIIGQIGDLCESLIKRAANIKDSGTLIPGHGGLLDRFDAIILAAPVFYYLVTWAI